MKGRAILIIEDEYLIALEIRAALEAAGAGTVETAPSESVALARLESSRWDAAVLDGNLHGHPLTRVAEALQAWGVPYLIVTGYGRESLPPEVGHAPVLEKPFRSGELIRMVSRLLKEDTPTA